MGVHVQILLQSKNWLACLIVPLTRLYLLSSVPQVSPATEMYVDKHEGVTELLVEVGLVEVEEAVEELVDVG